MRVADLEGGLLDLWVARADGMRTRVIASNHLPFDDRETEVFARIDQETGHVSAPTLGLGRMSYEAPEYSPSTNWEAAGPIIEREHIELLYYGKDGQTLAGNPWEAQIGCDTHYIDQGPGDAMGGPTPLIAAMRAFVRSKFGDEVEDAQP